MVIGPDNDPSFNPGIPILYQGIQYDRLYLTGKPFRGVNSAYQDFRAQVEQASMTSPNTHVGLDKLKTDDLNAESLAHIIRSLYHFNLKDLPNLKKTVDNIDFVIDITRLMINQTTDDIERSHMEKQLESYYLMLYGSMAQVLTYQKNYEWAKQLLNENLGRLDEYGSDQLNLFFELGNEINLSVKVSLPQQSGLEQYLQQKLKNVNTAEASTPGPHFNLLPDPTYHPQSLQAKKEEEVATENYEGAAVTRDRIFGNYEMFFDNFVNPFILFAGKELTSSLLPPDLDVQIGRDELRLERIVEGTPELVVGVKDTSAFKKIFEITDAELQARVLHLINSERYVSQFGRFNTDLVLVPSKTIM